MMTSVTEPGGTATLAAIDGYRVAGKAGTARRTNPKGGYYDDQYRTAFVGIAPASTRVLWSPSWLKTRVLTNLVVWLQHPCSQCDEKPCVCTMCRLTSRYRVKETTAASIESVNDL